MSKLWGGRFKKDKMDEEVMAFTSSLSVDNILAKYDIFSTKIHVEMLHKCGYVSKKEKDILLKVLESCEKDMEKGHIELAGHEDIHSVIQYYVEMKAPDESKKMHTGRSRNEQIVNDVRLYCKDMIDSVIDLITGLQAECVYKAESSIDVVIAGYTHLNRAQPVLFSHLLMAYTEMLERDRARLLIAKSNCDVSIMGSGAIGGSSLGLDRDFTAKKLGLSVISANSIDAVSDRDFIIEFVSGLAIIATHLSRIAEDLILYSTSEFGYLETGEEFCTGSSLMPQKKNQDVLELIRGKASSVIGDLNSLLILLKGLPHSYNRDLQEDKKYLFESVYTVSSSLSLMARIIASLSIKDHRDHKKLNEESIYATDIAEYLVRKGVAFKDAHKITGEIVTLSIEKGIDISDMDIKSLKGFAEQFEEDIYGLLDPAVSVNMKKTYGSTNTDMVKREIQNWKERLKNNA